jgi:aryl-alcohol dehydrogenase-like predicted oxidoreductase
MSMEIRSFGRSGLYVSEFALGAMTFGMPGWGCDEATSIQLIDRYLEAGGNFLDTADGYGLSEEICGRAIKAKRDQVVIGTKFGLPVGAGPHDRGTSRIHIKRACEQSLRKLQTDYIDLYQLHVDDLATPLEETMAALDDLVREGKVLYLGASNMLAYRLMKALAICDRSAATRFVGFQGLYNLVARNLEREHFGLFEEEGLGFISWSPLAAGLLTGKVSPESKDGETRLLQRSTRFDIMHKNEHGFAVAELVKRLATKVGCSPAQLALAWQRTRPVSSVIIGARTMDQLEDNLAALDVNIPEEVLDELEEGTKLPDEYPSTFIDIFQELLRGGQGMTFPSAPVG